MENQIKTPARDKTLDAVKGIGIILMVLGHSGTPFERFIYLFHMALFFMASGYVWNDKKVADLPTLGRSIVARVRGLWLPYFLANGSFTLLNNVFVSLGIYGQEKWMTLPQTAVQFCKNMLMAGDTQMGGASWFLRCLLFVSVAHLLVRYIACHWKHGKPFFYAVVTVTVVGAVVINGTHWKLPMGIETCFAGYTAFLMGMAIRKLRLTERLGKHLPLAAAGAFVLLGGLCFVDNIGMGAGNISSLPFFVTASVAGWIMTWGVATVCKGRLQGILADCGKHSVWIVMLHFLAFKPVAWLYLQLTGGDMAGLSAFPVFAAPFMWLPYAAAGVLIPLGIQALAGFFRGKKQ